MLRAACRPAPAHLLQATSAHPRADFTLATESIGQMTQISEGCRHEARRLQPAASVHVSKDRQVVNGDGPCNAERLEARNKSHNEGRWVREALEAKSRKAHAAA